METAYTHFRDQLTLKLSAQVLERLDDYSHFVKRGFFHIAQAERDVTDPNGSEDRRKNRMKDERTNDTRDATNRDQKRNKGDFDPGMKASAPNENDDPDLHMRETVRALSASRQGLMEALNLVPPSDEEQARKGNDETRRDRERRDRNQNLPFADLRREGGNIVPVTTQTITRKDGIIDAISQLRENAKDKKDKDKRDKSKKDKD